MRTALDTNTISALWSMEPLAPKMEFLMVRARHDGGLAICGPVYAELSAHPNVKPGFVDRFLTDTKIDLDFVLGEAVWREAARGFADYAVRRRQSGHGEPKRLLADFIIGAHALLKADRLLTLDPGRYTKDFPHLKLFPL